MILELWLLRALVLVLLRRVVVLNLSVGILLVLGGALTLEVEVGLLPMAGTDLVGSVRGGLVVGGDSAKRVLGVSEGVLYEQILVRLLNCISVCKFSYSL